jgi:prepilin-type N-terminal cleavage/methylation domain-containing protein
MKTRMHQGAGPGFTLIELLVVITIIGVLAAISFPVYNKIITKAREVQAKNDAMGIKNAVKAFYTEYGLYPFPTDEAEDTVMKETDAEFMRVLLAEEEEGGSGGSGSKVLNRRGIVYFAANPANNGRSGIDQEGNFLDPWGQVYRVYMDGDYNQKITIEDVGNEGDTTRQTDMRLEIGVVSAGKPRTSDELGKNIFDDNNEITTW